MGNYMNSGSRNAQTFGFELSYLTKVSIIHRGGSIATCTVEDIKKLTFGNSRTIVLQFHLLLVTVAIVF